MAYSLKGEIARLELEKTEMLMLANEATKLREHYLRQAEVCDIQIRTLKAKLAREDGNAKPIDD